MAEADGRRRRVLSLRGKLMLAAAAPVMFLLLLELCLYLGGYEGRPDIALYDRMPHEKAAGTLRIAVVGGSAAAGAPLDHAAGPVEILGLLLRDVVPDTPVEVFNCAVNALASDGVLTVAEKILPRQVDILVVYSGHNEFFTVGIVNEAVTRWSPDPQAWYERTRTWRLLGDMALLLRGGEDAGDTRTRTERAVAGRVGAATDYKPGSLAPDYEARLRRLVDMAAEHGTRVVLCTLASNVSSAPPTMPRHREGLTDAQLAAWQKAYGTGRERLAAGEVDEALASFAAAAAIDDGHADLLYATGQAYLAAGQPEKAAARLVAAKDRDFMAMRQTSARNDAVRRLAAPSGVVLADVEDAFRSRASDTVFLDHVHLSADGCLHLARAWAQAIEQAGLLGDAARWDWSAARSAEDYIAMLAVPPAQRAAGYKILALQMAHNEIGGSRVPALSRPEMLDYLRRRGPELFAMAIREDRHALDDQLALVDPIAWCYIARAYALTGDHARAEAIYKRTIDAAPALELSCEWLREAERARKGPDALAQPCGGRPDNAVQKE
jgi:tetratricopeptide (TPR) repeat protein